MRRIPQLCEVLTSSNAGIDCLAELGEEESHVTIQVLRGYPRLILLKTDTSPLAMISDPTADLCVQGINQDNFFCSKILCY